MRHHGGGASRKHLYPTLLASMALTLALALPATAASAPKTGKWKGKTSSGHSVNFKVKGGKVRSLKIGGVGATFCTEAGSDNSSTSGGITRVGPAPLKRSKLTLRRGKFSADWKQKVPGGSNTGTAEVSLSGKLGKGKGKGKLKATWIHLETFDSGFQTWSCVIELTWKAKRVGR